MSSFKLVKQNEESTEQDDFVLAPTAATQRKIILRILPLLCLGFVASVLDRVNFGNAHLSLVDPTFILDPSNFTNETTIIPPVMTELEYGWAGSAFSIGYIAFEVPSNMLLKKTGARYHFTRICFLWGLTSLCMTFITNGTGAIICRFFLGVAEAGYFPGVIYYLSSWFVPEQRSQILAYFYIGIPIAGFLGGLLGYGLLQMDGILGLRGWQWLFIIEALPSILLSLCFCLFLPDNAEKCTFLTPKEKEQVQTALRPYQDTSKALSLKDVKLAFVNIKVWAVALAFLCINIPRDILGLFTPSIISKFGFDPVLSNLLSAPMHACNLVLMLLLSILSTRLRITFPFIILPLSVSLLGWLALSLEFFINPSAIPLAAFYTTLLIVLSTASAFVAVFWSWVLKDFGHFGDANTASFVVVAIGIINSCGNASGLISPVMSSAIIEATNSYGGVAAAAAASETVATILLFIIYLLGRKKENFIMI